LGQYIRNIRMKRSAGAGSQQVQARGLIVRMSNRDFIGSPIRMSRTPPGLHRGPAEIGEHTREVLVEAGFSSGEVESLLASGALLQGAPP
jgi:alpha-methylacyl-CoA racemase